MKDTIKRYICNKLGHKWTYYRSDNGKDFRVCDRCHMMEEWKWLMGKQIWSISIRFKEKGAKDMVKGYGIP